MSVVKTSTLTGGVGILSVWAIYSATQKDSNIIVFNFEGSSSMKPIMEFLMHKYQNENREKNAEEIISFNISAVGSNAGLKKILSGDADFALVSHDILKLPKDSNYSDKWKEKKLKTITLAKEAMLVLYKAPAGCDSSMVISSQNIANLYSVFSGHKYESSDLNLKSLIVDADGKCDSELFPWVKSTGPIKSGTAKAFVANPLLNSFCNGKSNGEKNKCDEWVKKVKSGYGSNVRLNYVPESTSLHWDNFKSNLKVGSITYLPSHFVFSNWEVIQEQGLKVAQYKKGDSDSAVELKLENFDKQWDNYNWFRTFNLVYSVDSVNKGKNKELLTSLIKTACLLKELKLGTFKYKVKNDSNATDGSCADNAIEVDLETPDDTDTSKVSN